MKRSSVVNLSVVAVLLVSIAVVGAFAVSGAFDGLTGDGDGPPEDDGGLPFGPPADGSDDRSGGGSSDPPVKKMRLLYVNHVDYILAGGSSGEYDVMAYNLDNDRAYTGELVLKAEVFPSTTQITEPVHVPPNEGLYSFHVKFDRPGTFNVKVAPYDKDGNVIGDPIEVPTKSLTLQEAVATGSGAIEYTGETQFRCQVDVPQSDTKRREVVGVDRITFTLDNKTRDADMAHPNVGVTVGTVNIANTDIKPGAPYVFTIYNGDRVVATASGNAPS